MSFIVLYVIWDRALLSVSKLIETYQVRYVTYHQRYVNQQGRHLEIWYVWNIFYVGLYRTIN